MSGGRLFLLQTTTSWGFCNKYAFAVLEFYDVVGFCVACLNSVWWKYTTNTQRREAVLLTDYHIKICKNAENFCWLPNEKKLTWRSKFCNTWFAVNHITNTKVNSAFIPVWQRWVFDKVTPWIGGLAFSY